MIKQLIVILLLAFTSSLTYANTKTVNFVNPENKKIGTAKITELKKGVRIELRLTGLQPGVHGFHIHETGICKTPDFKSAGEHFTFLKQKHGFDVVLGPHTGDLPNIVADKDGNVAAEFINTNVSLRRGIKSLIKNQGTAFVIHSGADDYKSQPSGNSGDRIACAEIR